QKEHRAAHKAAAGDAVELGHAAGEPRRVVGGAGERLECEQAAFARRPARHLRPRGGGIFLGNGVPLAASVALALPAAINGTAVLTDEACVTTGHGRASSEQGAVNSVARVLGFAVRSSALIDPVIATAEIGQRLV